MTLSVTLPKNVGALIVRILCVVLLTHMPLHEFPTLTTLLQHVVE